MKFLDICGWSIAIKFFLRDDIIKKKHSEIFIQHNHHHLYQKHLRYRVMLPFSKCFYNLGWSHCFLRLGHILILDYYIFPPVFGCCILQMLVKICLFNDFYAKKLKNWRKSNNIGAKFSKWVSKVCTRMLVDCFIPRKIMFQWRINNYLNWTD